MEDALWRNIVDLRIVDDDTALSTLRSMTALVDTDLPQLLRPDFVQDACAFIHHEKEKPLLEKLRFLTTREVYENELFCALRILARNDQELNSLPDLEKLKRACRHIRIDLVESAMQFFEAKAVQRNTFADKVTFLLREQQLSQVEIEEALDKLADGETLPQPPPDVAPLSSKPQSSAPAVPVSKLKPETAADASANSKPAAADAPANSKPAAADAPAATAATKPDTRSRLHQAVVFLQSLPNMEQGAEFLTRKGYTPDEAREAVSVKRICDFINQPSRAPTVEKTKFLLSRGISQHDIDLALKLLNKSSNANVQRAMDFLSNPQTSSQPLADKIAFLKKQGLTEAEISEAIEAKFPTKPRSSVLKMSNTNAEGAAKQEFAPAVLKMCQTLLLNLDPGRFPKQRAAFLAVLLTHERGVLLRQTKSRSVPNRGWGSELDMFLDEINSNLNLPGALDMFDWMKHVARLAAIRGEYLNLLLGLKGEEVLAQTELDFTLTRALHLHFACQLSVLKLTSAAESFSALAAAALLRGFTDFGSGLASKSIQAELKPLLLVQATGVGNVYAGENWCDLSQAWPAITDLVFTACIPKVFKEDTAQLVCKSTAFRLTSTIADMLTRVEQKQAFSNAVLAHGNALFASVLENDFVSTTLAKHIVLQEESKGEDNAGLIRLFQTVYLVLVVFIESCVDFTEFLPQWDLVSHFAFARVHSDEAIRLIDLFDMLVVDNKLAMRYFANAVSKLVERFPQGDNFVLGAKVDYLLQTAPKVLKWEVDLDCDKFAELLLYGAKHDIPYLSRDCNVYVTDAVRDAAVTAAAGNKEEKPPLQLAICPQYFESLAEGERIDAQVLAFSVGSVLTSLGSSASEFAPSLACLAYFKFVGVERHAGLSFMALKAVALPSLSLCLDRVEDWLRVKGFAAMQKNSTEMRVIRELLYGIISRIEDAPRRGLLMVWFLSHVNDWDAVVAKL